MIAASWLLRLLPAQPPSHVLTAAPLHCALSTHAPLSALPPPRIVLDRKLSRVLQVAWPERPHMVIIGAGALALRPAGHLDNTSTPPRVPKPGCLACTTTGLRNGLLLGSYDHRVRHWNGIPEELEGLKKICAAVLLLP